MKSFSLMLAVGIVLVTTRSAAQAPVLVPAWDGVAPHVQAYTLAAARTFGTDVPASPSSAGGAGGIDHLASLFPEQNQSSARRTLRGLMLVYPRVEQQFGAPRAEPATALAAMIAGSWAAARQATLADAEFAALVQQMRRAVAADPSLATIDDAARADAQQQMAALGMLMTTLTMQRQRGTSPATIVALQETGRDYLRRAFGVDPDRARLTDAGLVVDPTPNRVVATTAPATPAMPGTTRPPTEAPVPNAPGKAAPTPDPVARGLRAPVIGNGKYPYSTAPGMGVPAADVEVVLYQFIAVYYPASFTDKVFLLLRDGTVHDGLDVSPADMDIARSRQGEPSKWGRWRREGTGYAFAWPGRPNQYNKVNGSPYPALQRGARIEGEWSWSSSYELGGAGSGGASTYSEWGVQLRRDGRFVASRSGFSSVGGGSSGQPITNTVSDDNGASTVSIGGVAAIGTSSRKADTGDRSGTYAVDGYTMTLTYDNGRVVRTAFFYDPASQGVLYFDGSVLSRKSRR